MSFLGNYRPRQYQVLVSEVVALQVRQHPKYAVVTPENKEKMRKPVDPPPIVQLKVDRRADVGSNFLVNPFLFMTASLVETEERENGSYRPVPGVQIIGQNVSSLHRLKDIDNKDGGFFVFGDISCRNIGQYRLQFNLFDLEKDNNQVVFVESVVSEPFKVVSQKEFRGLSESTHLSRTFSDQGVRLRLRKEPRTITGSKRTWDSSPPEQSTSPMHQNVYGGQSQERSYGYDSTMFKRTRSDSDHNPYSYPPSQYSGSSVSQYSSNVQGSGSPWSAHPQQSFQTDPSPSFGALAIQPHPQSGGYPVYQRPLQQGPYSAPAGAMGSNYYFGHASAVAAVQRNQTSTSYTQQPSPGYDPQPPRDAHQAPPSIQVLGQPANSTLPSNQHQSFLSSSTESPGELGGVSSTSLQSHQMPQHPSMQSGPAQFGLQPGSMHSSIQAYQSPAHPGAQSVVYDQPGQLHVGKYEQSHYQSGQDMYSDHPPREQFSATTAALADATLSLDAGMLNRGFAPPQISAEQDLSGFKQQPDPYPTPHQTSPMGSLP